MSINLTPISTGSDLVTSARAQDNSQLDALATSNPDLLAALITTASTAIRRVCKRSFNQASYTEYVSGQIASRDRLQEILLREFPIASVTRVAGHSEPAIQIRNTSAANQRATARVSSTGVVLTRVASGVSTVSTLLFSDYVTLSAMATAINALSNGWTATVLGDFSLWPSADLRATQGAFTAIDGAGAQLELYREVLEAWGYDTWSSTAYGFRSDDEAGILAGYFPRGTLNVRIDYVGGFATIPEDVQEACVQTTLDLYLSGRRDGTIKSAGVGPYRWEAAENRGGYPLSPKARGLVASYIDHSKLCSGVVL